MDAQLLLAIIATALIAGISLHFLGLAPWNNNKSSTPSTTTTPPPAGDDEPTNSVSTPAVFPEPAPYIKSLAAALPAPGTVVLPAEVAAFRRATQSYFSVENRTLVPACVVRPRDAAELGVAVAHLAREHASRLRGSSNEKAAAAAALFAVRSGGANPASGLATAVDGVVLDLGRLDEVSVAADERSVVVGAGIPWDRVYRTLEERGLAVVGGRSTPVGVGGSVLGGGLSYFSGRYGFMCSNVVSYEVVLAPSSSSSDDGGDEEGGNAGRIVTASADENPDLWRALKGGANNFGVVASFRLRCFPAGDVWIGSFVNFGVFAPSYLRAFHDYGVASARGTNEAGGCFDEEASTPIISMTYKTDLGMTFWWTQLSYATAPAATTNKDGSLSSKWPEHWAKSPFAGLWGFQRMSGPKKLSQAAADTGALSIPDLRHAYCTTTFRVDLATLVEAHRLWKEAIPDIKHVKGAMFTVQHQMLNPRWMHRGDPNVMGLEACDEPLVLWSFCSDWPDAKDDEVMRRVSRRVLEAVENAARKRGTAHPFRFINYCDSWQKPLEGSGREETQRFMRDVSAKYDPEGLFQTGCLGGFKLDAREGK